MYYEGYMYPQKNNSQNFGQAIPLKTSCKSCNVIWLQQEQKGGSGDFIIKTIPVYVVNNIVGSGQHTEARLKND